MDFLLGLLFPAWCRVCGRGLDAGESFFCAACRDGVGRLGPPFCTVCGRPFQGGAGGSHPCHDCMKKKPPYTLARAPFVYDGLIKEAIQLYKYKPVRGLKEYLGSYAAEGAKELFPSATVAVPVPLHKRRLRHRGFNQSLFLAGYAAEALGIRLSMDGLARTRHTRPQVDLGPEERERNVKGAFAAVRPEDFKAEKVLLVDDVYTTGATVRECAKVLKAAGASEVYVLTVARVV